MNRRPTGSPDAATGGGSGGDRVHRRLMSLSYSLWMNLRLPLAAAFLYWLALGQWMLWPALLPFLWFAVMRIQKAESATHLFGRAWLYWFLAIAASINWIEYVVRVYGGLPLPFSLGPLLLLSAYCALYPAMAEAGTLVLGRSVGIGKERIIWLWPPLLTGFELLRERLLTGFGWSTPGYAFADSRYLIQAADLAGVYGLTLLAAVLVVLASRTRLKWRITAALLLLVWTGYGVVRPQVLPKTHRALEVGVVQGNVDQWIKWNRNQIQTTVEIYTDQTRALAEAGPLDLVVWPETAMPFFYQRKSPWRDTMLQMADELDVMLLTGAPAYVHQNGKRESRNRAILIDRAGAIADHADKKHLVPFGEYVPLRPFLNFVEKLVDGVGDFSPGTDPGYISHNGLKIGISICYEILFAGETRDRLGSADLFAVITNDAWFGPTDAPHQLAAMSRMRAVENRIPLVRAANTGISLWVDGAGVVHRQTHVFQAASFRDTIPLVRGFSLYQKTGWWFEIAFQILALVTLGLSLMNLITNRIGKWRLKN